MKKHLCIILALVLILSLSVPALAVDDTRQTELSFYYYAPEPEYYVTIPDALGLELGDNYLEISVDSIANIGEKAVTVTFEETQTNWIEGGIVHSSLFLILPYGSGFRNIGYTLADSDGDLFGEFFKSTDEIATITSQIISAGTELLKFHEDGVDILVLSIEDEWLLYHQDLHEPTVFSGHIIFGIKLV